MNEARPDHIMQIGLGFWVSKILHVGPDSMVVGIK